MSANGVRKVTCGIKRIWCNTARTGGRYWRLLSAEVPPMVCFSFAGIADIMGDESEIEPGHCKDYEPPIETTLFLEDGGKGPVVVPDPALGLVRPPRENGGLTAFGATLARIEDKVDQALDALGQQGAGDGPASF